jgi:membrane protease YdiL (CAAX protease family)
MTGSVQLAANAVPSFSPIPEQHSLAKSLTLHLLPGALITVFFALLAPSLLRAGYPSMFTLLLAILVVLVPFELGYLLLEGRRLNGRWSLRGVVVYQEPTPLWQYFVLVPVLLFWSAFIFTVVAKPIDSFLIAKLFSWLPSWAFFEQTDFSQYTSAALRATLFLNLAFNGLLGPFVEELYFRGYLLPRISRFRWGAPLVNVILFSLYHFFSPWQNPVRILALIPLVYVVWRKRNIKISIIVHCLLNTCGILSSAALFLK